MDVPVSEKRHSVEEYFRLEAESEEKHDYVDGEILAMSGGSSRHSLITANLIGELHARLKGKPCRVYESNLRVAVRRDVRYSYPDLSIVCEEPEYDPKDKGKTTILNPRVVIEVLSPSTEAADRGEKFERYIKNQSLQEYVLISQHRPRFESFFRQSDGQWLFSNVQGTESSAEIRSVGVRLTLKDIYNGVEFDPEV